MVRNNSVWIAHIITITILSVMPVEKQRKLKFVQWMKCSKHLPTMLLKDISLKFTVYVHYAKAHECKTVLICRGRRYAWYRGRYCISLLFGDTDGYPFATLTVNLIGCFLLPFLLNHPNVKQKLAPELLTALTVGLIGSFTTFSTLAVETARYGMKVLRWLLVILWFLF